jgi:NAD(P)-dependent dehydrogenase (short-subunit alcohol dehydrogenase family)
VTPSTAPPWSPPRATTSSCWSTTPRSSGRARSPSSPGTRCTRSRTSSQRPRIVNVTSDAAAEPYEGWGGYGSAKAALDHLTAVLAVEHHDLRIYAVDPGDMNTRMHQEAFPGEDISDRPPPEHSVPGLLALIEGDVPSGRYRASELGALA